MSQRIESGIFASERSLPNENLVVTGWGCNSCDQKWSVSSHKKYTDALKAFSGHHCKGPWPKITWLYRHKNFRENTAEPEKNFVYKQNWS